MLLTSLAMGRTHPAWDAPPELPAGTMLTDIKRTMLRDLALMHQSQMPTSDSSTSPSRKDPTTSITINAVAARQIEVKREMCVIGSLDLLLEDLGSHARKHQTLDPERQTIRQTVINIGRLAGFQPSKRQPLPGNIKLWQGYVLLKPAVRIYLLMKQKE